MGKFRVLVECRNEGGTDLHCWIVEAKNPSEAFMQYQEKVPVADQTALQPHHSPRKRAVFVLHGHPAQG